MKKILSIILYTLILTIIIGCENNVLGGNKVLNKNDDAVVSVLANNMSCVPVQLNLYSDGTYELYTKYAACKSGQICNSILKYTKSVKGNYDYDVMKIIDNSINADDLSFTNDNLPEYEIYLGNKYVEKGYGYMYAIQQGKTNKYLNELLENLNINLNICANPEYK